jgi:dTDP-glucose 4,6-dehydratase
MPAGRHWKDDPEGKLFYHISTDEVYGSLGSEGLFTEGDCLRSDGVPILPPRPVPTTWSGLTTTPMDLPVVLSNCSNNYGPNQFPEKLIPLAIHNILHMKPIPVYGKGEKYATGLALCGRPCSGHRSDLSPGQVPGRTYNIGGLNEWKNIDLIRLLCGIMDEKLKRKAGSSEQLISFVTDRAGHDLRYAIDSSRIEKELTLETHP